MFSFLLGLLKVRKGSVFSFRCQLGLFLRISISRRSALSRNNKCVLTICQCLAGDIGYYSKKSRLFVVDRMKEMIRCMERQVAPAELQEILLQHPGVSEAVVVGVPHIEYGEAPRAFIVLRDGFGGDEIIEKELRKLVEGDSNVVPFCWCRSSWHNVMPKFGVPLGMCLDFTYWLSASLCLSTAFVNC